MNVTNNALYKWLHSDYLNNIETNFGVNRNTAYKQLKLNKFDEDLSRTKIKKTKSEEENINRWLHEDFIKNISKTFGIDEEEVYKQLKVDNFNEDKSLEYWNSYYA